MVDGYAYYRTDAPNEYKKVRIGVKSVEDAVLQLGSYCPNPKDRGNLSLIHI